jgi:hypothetical protein
VEAHAHVQRLVSVAKMATVLEEYATEEQHCIVRFYGKMTQCKGYSLKMFPVYSEKCLSRKAVHNWVEKFSEGRSKIAGDARPGRPVEIGTETKNFMLPVSTPW